MTPTRPVSPPVRPHTVGVIGAGRVGRAVTAAIVNAGMVSTVLVHSRRPVEAIALATDATDLAATQHLSTTITAVAHLRELLSCSVLVVCLWARFNNPAWSRLAGSAPNAPLVAELARQLYDQHCPVVMVTNPVDLMTRLWSRHSYAPVFGIGSNLDSARYRALVAQHANVDVATVIGSVLGEHGPGATLCAHATRVRGQPITLPWSRLREQLHARSPAIAAGLDRTQHGPAGAVLSTVRKLLGYADGHEELSVATSGGVWLGQRLRFAGGLHWPDPPELSIAEAHELRCTESRLAALYDHLLPRS